MVITPRLRKLALTAHVTLSVGWLGAVIAYLALAVAGRTSQDAEVVRAAYVAMELIGWYVIVPCSLAALLTGLVQSLITAWGLFRHYWVVAKLVLSAGGTIVLLLHMRAVSLMSSVAAERTLYAAEFAAQRVQLLVHAGGGLLVLLAATALSVYKPWGRTGYGRRMLQEQRVSKPEGGDAQASFLLRPGGPGVPGAEASGRRDAAGAPRRNYEAWIIAVLLLLLLALHVAGGGFRGH